MAASGESGAYPLTLLARDRCACPPASDEAGADGRTCALELRVPQDFWPWDSAHFCTTAIVFSTCLSGFRSVYEYRTWPSGAIT